MDQIPNSQHSCLSANVTASMGAVSQITSSRDGAALTGKSGHSLQCALLGHLSQTILSLQVSVILLFSF